MADMNSKKYEIRCPIYGFVVLNDWEMFVVNNPFFQRLRRIHQLGWTHYIYPGAMHTRFEHSLGVMHMAGRIFDAITEKGSKSWGRIEKMYGFNREEFPLNVYRQLVRFAALLHDVGHAPFSHAGEESFPYKDEVSGERYRHEDYSVAIIRHYFKDSIEGYLQKLEKEGKRLPLNDTMSQVTAERVASLIEGSFSTHDGDGAFRSIISGQLDADRMDYLLRDAYHTGVAYGNYDWRRLIHTLCYVVKKEDDKKTGALGVEYGGHRDAEGLLLSRYAMFKQVYSHKTRTACDDLYQSVLQSILLEEGTFPKPDKKGLEEYLCWDDNKVLEKMAQNARKARCKKEKGSKRDVGEEACRRLYDRDPLRLVCFYDLFPEPRESKIDNLKVKAYFDEMIRDFLSQKRTDGREVRQRFLVVLIAREWYKGKIPVVVRDENENENENKNKNKNKNSVVLRNLESLSSIASSLRGHNMYEWRIYVDKDDKEDVRTMLQKRDRDIRKSFPQLRSQWMRDSENDGS
ncbi:MAG: HD domain-containing protein [Alphaproteobacteria bacterium GM202ARS2]|nr:HD domain-containing protein [Alphaproteobacteria bacterium GM202ARS2]